MATFIDRGILQKTITITQTVPGNTPLTTIYTAPTSSNFLYAIYFDQRQVSGSGGIS